MNNRQLIYVIRDKVAEQNTPLFIMNNDGAAIRQYKQFVLELPAGASPDDFLLFCVGVWDPDRMMINSHLDPDTLYPVLVNTAVTVSETLSQVAKKVTGEAVNYVP